MKTLEVKQGNPFYDASRTNNGGGYDQPIITFEHNGIVGTFSDRSCGDFGTRYELEYDGISIAWGSMYGDDSDHWPEEWGESFRQEFLAEFGGPCPKMEE